MDEFDEAPVDVPEVEMESTDTQPEIVSDGAQDHQLDTDLQINDAISSLSQMDGLDAQSWVALDTDQRLETLQNVENQMAEIQGRPAFPVTSEEMSPNEFGGYDGEGIRINSGHLAGNEVPVDEMVDTLVHEGRHGYQDYAIQNPGTVSDQNTVNAWSENFENYVTVDQVDYETYVNQPVEADAWDYADQIRSGLYPEEQEI